MATLKTALRSTGIYEGLAVVTLDGYEPKKLQAEDGGSYADQSVDPPGSANFLVDTYGFQGDEFDPEVSGILWTDYDCGEWGFSVLIASDEVEALEALALAKGYEVVEVQEVAEPQVYGDGHAGTITILKHPEGWVIL